MNRPPGPPRNRLRKPQPNRKPPGGVNEHEVEILEETRVMSGSERRKATARSPSRRESGISFVNLTVRPAHPGRSPSLDSSLSRYYGNAPPVPEETRAMEYSEPQTGPVSIRQTSVGSRHAGRPLAEDTPRPSSTARTTRRPEMAEYAQRPLPVPRPEITTRGERYTTRHISRHLNTPSMASYSRGDTSRPLPPTPNHIHPPSSHQRQSVSSTPPPGRRLSTMSVDTVSTTFSQMSLVNRSPRSRTMTEAMRTMDESSSLSLANILEDDFGRVRHWNERQPAGGSKFREDMSAITYAHSDSDFESH